ncbi:MAG: glycosyltransferase family 4 protein [Chitinophagaceae bacterium]|nr:glycosyltransferase family 4 protein [Chitinophagaceae bacterium]
MKIGIEAQRIFRAGKHGMDVVALELIRRLQKKDTSNEYRLFAARGPDTDCIGETPNFHTSILSAFTYADWEQVSLPAAIKKNKSDILHCTGNTAPLNCRIPLILTLHDIIYLEETSFKGSLYQNIGNIYRKWIVPYAIKKAACVITVSDYEKRIIEKYFPGAASKIAVVPNGVDERFNNKYSKEEIALFRKKYSLPEKFILYLGNTAPKKNTANVVKAYAHYCESEKYPLAIVITDYDKRHVERILSSINKSLRAGSFIFPGYVPVNEMPLLYNCSTLFLYPSLRESFGLPILEAMACGVPVITSNTSAMPETAGAAAELIDPDDYKIIAESISKLITDEALRNSYTQKGLARASHFSWDNSAGQLLKIYSDHQH